MAAPKGLALVDTSCWKELGPYCAFVAEFALHSKWGLSVVLAQQELGVKHGGMQTKHEQSRKDLLCYYITNVHVPPQNVHTPIKHMVHGKRSQSTTPVAKSRTPYL